MIESMRRLRRDPTSAIEIIASPHRDDCSYELHPQSRRTLRERYPNVTLVPSLFVGYETQADFEELHGKMWTQIVTLLTGLSPKRLANLGGVYVIDPSDESILMDTRSKAAA